MAKTKLGNLPPMCSWRMGNCASNFWILKKTFPEGPILLVICSGMFRSSINLLAVEASFSWGLGGQWAAALWLELSYLWSRYHQVAFLMSTYAKTRQNFWRKITIFINLSKEETHPSHSWWFQHIWRLVRLDNLPKGQCEHQTYLKLLRLWVNHCHHPYNAGPYII